MRDQRKSKGEKHAEKAPDYRGITPDALWLLAENRFQNSKEFYESKKPAIKEQVLIPMQQICAALADRMEKIDDKICLVPTRMVSRIRRDTRFTKDKTLYREHVWITFMRPKKEFPCSPAFWFEITPQGYRFGVGFYCTTPQLMQAYRSAILEDPAAFRKAVKKAERAGFAFGGESYKKNRPGDVPENLRDYFNRKDTFVCRENPSLLPLQDAGIIEELREGFSELVPLYHFLLKVSEDANGIKSESYS